MFNGLGVHLGNIAYLSPAKTRSISAENPTGEKGRGGMATEGVSASCARELGQGWKVNPYVLIQPGETVHIAEIEGPGAIQSIWMTCIAKHWRELVLRFYWDDEEQPSVETPYGDFFCNGWAQFAPVNSLPISCNPMGGMNAYWEMPFRKSAKITVESLATEPIIFFYQINYALTEVPDYAAYFHAQWRRANPLPYKEPHTILDGVRGRGQYVGTYVAWGVNNNGWWGEGEVKFYLDGDRDFPTICGTGTEDYFGGAWCFEAPGGYGVYSTPFLGLCQVIKPNGHDKTQTRFGMYRWHIPDPIRFESDLRVTMQALGWRSGGRYLPLQDDIASTAFWYQTEPHAPFPLFPHRDDLEVI